MKTLTVGELNKINVTTKNIYGAFDANGIMYVPCTINHKNWVLKITGLNIEDCETLFIDRFNMALSLNGGTIEGVEKSLTTNGFPCKIVGGVNTLDADTITNLELDATLYN